MIHIDWRSFLNTCRSEANRPQWENRPGADLWSTQNYHSEIDRDLRERRTANSLNDYLWDRLTSENLATFFYFKPDIFDECPQQVLETIEGSDWSWLLQRVPECAKRCDWSKLNEKSWASLLSKQPQFANKCDLVWDKLDGHDWTTLLCKQPQFADKCERCWDKLDGQDWTDLLSKQPQFADKCERWHDLTWPQVKQLLDNQPILAKCCLNCQCWDQLTGNEWSSLLRKQTEFADKCELFWDKLEGHDWTTLLCKQPQFADKCDQHWGTLNVLQVKQLIDERPELAEYCRKWPYWHMNGEQWAVLLQQGPSLARFCDAWGELNWRQVRQLLINQPELAESCHRNWPHWDRLTGNDWVKLLCKRPMFANICDWGKLNGNDWVKLLCKRPMFANKCDWSKLNGNDWVDLLLEKSEEHPEFAEKCDWGKLDGNDWARLLYEFPSFASECEQYWGKLKSNDWLSLLFEYPDSFGFAEKCDWSIFDWRQVKQLLDKKLKLAKYCRNCQCWNQLTGSEWGWLLHEYHEFADICEQHLNDLDAADLNKLLCDLHISDAAIEARLSAKINAQKKIELDQFRQQAAARTEILRDFRHEPPNSPLKLHNHPEPYLE